MDAKKREQANVDIIKSNNQVSVIALQECSKELIDSLKENLDKKYIFEVFENTPKDNGVIIYDSSVLELLSSHTVRYKAEEGDRGKNYIMNLKFKVIANSTQLTFINTHTPFKLAGQLRDYLNCNDDLHGIVLVMGDMNVGFHDSRKECDLNLQLLNGLKDYSNLSNCTIFSHINPRRN